MAFRELISHTQPTAFHVDNGICDYRVVIESVELRMPFMPHSEQGIIEYFSAIDLLFSDEADEEVTLTISNSAPAELLYGLNINCEVILYTPLFSELQCRKLIIEPIHMMTGYEFINTYELEITHGHLHRIITGSFIVTGCKIVTIDKAGPYANNKTALAFRRVFPNAEIIYFKTGLKLNRVTINKINKLINLGFIVAYNRYDRAGIFNIDENIAFIPFSYNINPDFIHERSENYYISHGSVYDIINASVAMNYKYDTALIKNANK
jgi:hypothetical protein